MTDAQRAALVDGVTRALGRRGVKREGSELRFQCFDPDRHANGDANWSAYFNPAKAVWLCRVCGARGGVLDLADRLGVPRPQLDDLRLPRLEDFARARCLMLDTLRRFAVRPVVEFWRPALRYPTPVGIDRLKFLDGRKPKYRWAEKGGRVHWYGFDSALAGLRAGASTLHLVNGEPSVWACAQSGVPALCPCGGEGAKPTSPMAAELETALRELGRPIAVRIVYDRDTAGRRGAIESLRPPLAAAGLDVEALDIAPMLADVVGADVDDLHRRVGDGALAAALNALPRLTPSGATNETDMRGPWARAVTAAVFIAETDPEVDWLEPRLLAQGSVTEWFSPRGLGKTQSWRSPSSSHTPGTACCCSIGITPSGRCGDGFAPGGLLI
jgi:hypothetical protein